MNALPQFPINSLIESLLILSCVYALRRTFLFQRALSDAQIRLSVIGFGMVSGTLSGIWVAAHSNAGREGLHGELVTAFVTVGLFSGLFKGFWWFAFYEVIRFAKKRLSGETVASLLGLTGLIWVLDEIVGAGTLIVTLALSGRSPPDFSQLPPGWLQAVSQYSYHLSYFLGAATFVGVVYLLEQEPYAVRATQGEFWQVASFGDTGGSDMDATNPNSQTTRLLCASAFLGGSHFRRTVLNFLEDPNRAAAPELGLDLGLVAQVCKFAERRNRRFDWIFLGCLVAAGISTLTDPDVGTVIGLVVLVLAGATVYLAKAWKEGIRFPESFAKDEFDSERSRQQFKAELEPEEHASLPENGQNLIVYRGFSPFVGAGMSLGGWSFIINVDKGKQDETGTTLEPVQFESLEIYSKVNDLLNSLGLNGLQHQDMYFVNGSEIRRDRNILPNDHGRPVQFIGIEDQAKYQTANDRRIRHYKWIRVMDWGNEMCTSYFLRCTLRGSNMFVEINRYLLTPLASQYRKVDSLAEAHWQKMIGLVIASLFVGPVKAIAAPFILFQRMQEYVGELFDRKQKNRDRLIDETPLFNYGTGSSLRESLSGGQFIHYFQKLDGDFYTKVLEREILAAIVEFLDEHNIDTSEFKERQSTILNSGIIIHGGDVTAQSLAVGTGAQVTVAPQTTASKPASKRAARKAAA